MLVASFRRSVHTAREDVAGLKADVPAGAPDSATRKLVAEELERVIHSSEFASSERSCTFLRYLVEHALAHGEHQLKERTIGVELFGRDAAYDTGRDAIVRVSANGVRKRLLAHYATTDLASELGGLQICLPAGSYTPEFHSLPPRQRETALPSPSDRVSPPVSARPAWRTDLRSEHAGEQRSRHHLHIRRNRWLADRGRVCRSPPVACPGPFAADFSDAKLTNRGGALVRPRQRAGASGGRGERLARAGPRRHLASFDQGVGGRKSGEQIAPHFVARRQKGYGISARNGCAG